MASNSTLPPLPSYELTPQSPLIPGIPDQYLALALPVIAYWVESLFFHFLDVFDLFPQYRLHTPAEVLKRNHASRWDVCRDVIVQQILQTVTGLILAMVEGTPLTGSEHYDIAVWAQKIRIVEGWFPTALGVLGVDALGLAHRLETSGYGMLAGAVQGGTYPTLTQTLVLGNGKTTAVAAFAAWELQLAKTIYHVLVPAFQFAFAIAFVDTYQYFIHRAMHMNKWLYTTFHARHHRLYVPYAYGALYNHPGEALLLDTVGTGLAYLVSGMTCRQSMWFYTLTTMKTVDDHCGYCFPWDPLQHLTGNNAGYHDVHHQSWGIKTNFSQPFFTFWDRVLGTKWTGGDVSARYERAKIAAQKKVDDDNAMASKTKARGRTRSITGSVPSDSLDAKGPNPYADASVSASAIANAIPERRSSLKIPLGKATQQAQASRQMVLEVDGPNVLAEESAEERAELQNKQQVRRTSPRKKTRRTSSGFKGFADRVGESLQGKATGVLGVESRR
jgi:sphinganine C4-monooxygenase